MEGDIIEKAIKHYSQAIKAKRDRLRDCLNSTEVTHLFQATKVQGGFYIWLKMLDEKTDTEGLLKVARKYGVSYVPGKIYFTEPNANNPFFRLAYSQIRLEHIEEAVMRLRRAILSTLNP